MRWVVGLIVALWLGGCSRTGLLVDDAGTDAGTDAAEADAGCGHRPPHASLPPCDDPGFWALEPTRCFEGEGCGYCDFGPQQPFAPRCVAPFDSELGRPTRICYRERFVGEGWSYGEIRENRQVGGWPDDGLRVFGWAPVRDVELEVRPVFGDGDFSHAVTRSGAGACDPFLGGCAPQSHLEHPEPVEGIARDGHFLTSRGAHTRIAATTVTTPATDVSSIVSLGWGLFAWLEGPHTIAIAASPQRRGEEIVAMRETLPGNGPTQLISFAPEDSSLLIARGDRLLEAGASVSIDRRLSFRISEEEHTLEGVPLDVAWVGSVVAYRVGDQIFARDRRELAVPLPVGPLLTSGARRLVPGFHPDAEGHQLVVLIDDQLHAVSASNEAGLRLRPDVQPDALVVPASELIGVTSDGRQLGTRSIATPVENPYGPERLELDAYFGAPIRAMTLDVFYGRWTVQGWVAVERGAGSMLYEVGEPISDGCGL